MLRGACDNFKNENFAIDFNEWKKVWYITVIVQLKFAKD